MVTQAYQLCLYPSGCTAAETVQTVLSSEPTAVGTATRVILVNRATASPDDGSDGSGGLSNDAKIAIGVNAAVAITIIAVALFFLWRRKPGRSFKPGSHEHSTPDPVMISTYGYGLGAGKPELEEKRLEVPS
ncbi:hypothetical protein FQN54_002535 [Arachnomyces sp. PD_36]|nr:hypothetical protein FQN54_002535 [Arachnomyces sp. PD_36]